LTSNPTLKSKKELIDEFINSINVEKKQLKEDSIEKEWDKYIQEQKKKELKKIINNTSLKLDEIQTKKYINKCFKNGEIIENGTSLADILKLPKSPFSSETKQRKKDALNAMIKFFEKFYDISNSEIQ
jgi:type I site-specific restriction-modification system R (restriction) subunit